MSSGDQQAADASGANLAARVVSHNAAPANHEKQDGPVEIGGRGGLEPTRYGDWEKNGRCIDF
jgi:hypothetical protein